MQDGDAAVDWKRPLQVGRDLAHAPNAMDCEDLVTLLGACTKDPGKDALLFGKVLAPTNGMEAPTRNGIAVPKWKR